MRFVWRLVRLAVLGAVVYLALGAGLGGGAGITLPDGSRYIFRFQVAIDHIPAPEPEAAILPVPERS